MEVIDDRHTGETILDETLKMMKAQEGSKFTINSWIDLLSGKCFKRRREETLEVPWLCDDFSVSHKEGDLPTVHLQGKHGMS